MEGYESFTFNFYRRCLGLFSQKLHCLPRYVSYWHNFSQRINSEIYNIFPFLRSFSFHCLKNVPAPWETFKLGEKGRYQALFFQSHFGDERIVEKVFVKDKAEVRLLFPFGGQLGMNPPRAERWWQLRFLPRLQTYQSKNDSHCSIMTASPAFFICLWHSCLIDPFYISTILLIFYFLLTAKFTRLCRLNQTSPPYFFVSVWRFFFS